MPRNWLSIPAADRASVVEMTRQTPPTPFPTIAASVADVRAWAMAQGIEWDSHDHDQISDAYIVARYEAVGHDQADA